MSRRGAAPPGVVLLAAVLLAAVVLGGCPVPECEEKTDLVAMDQWVLLAPEDDPFDPPADAPLCTTDDIRMEPFGAGGPITLDVDTSLGCGWATLTQPLVTDIAADDKVTIRVFYYSQTTFPAAEAELALTFGGELFWTDTVPIPANSDLTPRTPLPATRDVPAGTPVHFHVGNHGDNSWNLLELSRTRKVFCSE